MPGIFGAVLGRRMGEDVSGLRSTQADVTRARVTEALVRLERLRLRVVAAKMPSHSVELLDQAMFLLRAERDEAIERG